jgi:ATP-binding cassette subfamily C protein
LLHLPYHFYAQRYAGEVVNRSGLNETLVSLIAGQLTGTVIGLVSMVLFGIVLFAYDVTLTLVGVASSLMNFVILQAVSKSRVEANMRVVKESGKVQGATIAAIQGMEDLKASGMEDSFFTKWAGFYAASANSKLDLSLASMRFSVLPTLTNSLVSASTLVLGGLQIMNGAMTFGTLLGFQMLMTRFLGPMNNLLHLGMQLQQIRGNITRLADVMETPTRERELADIRVSAAANDQPDRASETDWSQVTRLQGLVECRNITYGYSPLEAPLIADFDLVLQPGQRVALVGSSGSGKSTIAKLVAGLLLPWSGEVRLDGYRLLGIPKHVLANSLAMVEQDVLLFEETVRQNLTLWDSTVPLNWLVNACRDASILDEVMALPGGFDGLLHERGENLSGGQRQRLEIARALIRHPSFVILDEATSALDAETEAIVDGNLRRRGCTCLVVAHRLSTIRDCDEIIVLDKGQVQERGTHEELWEAGGLYAQLLQQQDTVTAEA